MPTIEEQLRDYSTWLAAEADQRAAESSPEIRVRLAENEEQPGGRRWQPLVAVAAVVALLAGGVWLSSLRAGDDPALGTQPPSPTEAPEPTTEQIAPPDVGAPSWITLGGIEVPVLGEPLERDGITYWQGASPPRSGVGWTTGPYDPVPLEEFADLAFAVDDDRIDEVVVLGAIDGAAYARVNPSESAGEPAFGMVRVEMDTAEWLGNATSVRPGSLGWLIAQSAEFGSYVALAGFPESASHVSYIDEDGNEVNEPIVGDTVILPNGPYDTVYRARDAAAGVLAIAMPGAGYLDPQLATLTEGEPVTTDDGVRIWNPATGTPLPDASPAGATARKIGWVEPADVWLGTRLPDHFTDAVVFGEWGDHVILRLFSNRDEGLRMMFSPVDRSSEPHINSSGNFVTGKVGILDVSDVDPGEVSLWLQHSKSGLLHQESRGGLVIVQPSWRSETGVVVGLDSDGNEVHRVGEGFLPSDPPPDSVTVRPLDQPNVDQALLDQLGDPTLAPWEPVDAADVPDLPGLEGDATVLGQLERDGSKWLVVSALAGDERNVVVVDLSADPQPRIDLEPGVDQRSMRWSLWGEVPDGTALVEYRFGDDRMAQVPTAGVVVFPAPQFEHSTGVNRSMIAYDEDGSVLAEFPPQYGLDSP